MLSGKSNICIREPLDPSNLRVCSISNCHVVDQEGDSQWEGPKRVSSKAILFTSREISVVYLCLLEGDVRFGK